MTAKEVPIYCIRCGRHIGRQKVPDDFKGNVVWGYCPECNAKRLRGVTEVGFLEELDMFIRAWLKLREVLPKTWEFVGPALERVKDMPHDTPEEAGRRLVEFIKALHEQRREKRG